MRKFQVNIELGNAALPDDLTIVDGGLAVLGEAAPELARILRRLADHLEGTSQPRWTLRDVNGNVVGCSGLVSGGE